MAALTVLGASLVAALILSATGSAADGDSRRAALGVVLVVAWLVGFGVGHLAAAAREPGPDASRILRSCPGTITISATCPPPPRNTCSPCASWSAPTTAAG